MIIFNPIFGLAGICFSIQTTINDCMPIRSLINARAVWFLQLNNSVLSPLVSWKILPSFISYSSRFSVPRLKKKLPHQRHVTGWKELNMFGEFSPFHFKLVRVSFFLFPYIKERCNGLVLVYIGPIPQRRKKNTKEIRSNVHHFVLCRCGRLTALIKQSIHLNLILKFWKREIVFIRSFPMGNLFFNENHRQRVVPSDGS